MNRNYILTARKRPPGIQNFTQAKEGVEQQDLVIPSVVPPSSSIHTTVGVSDAFCGLIFFKLSLIREILQR